MKQKLFFLKNLFKKKSVIFITIAVFLVLIMILVFSNKDNGEQTMTVKLSDFVNQISVSGKVVASSDVSLGFSQGGRVSSVRVKVGDVVEEGRVLASVENGDLRADLTQKEANLEKEEIRLKSLQLGTRPEQIAITESSLLSTQTAFNQAKQSLINSISDAYTKSDDAIKNKIDQFFKNPLTINPTIELSTSDSDIISKINSERYSIGVMLVSWEKSISNLNSNSDFVKAITEAENNMNQVKSFLSKVSVITNNPEVYSNTGVFQINWKTDTSTARLAIDNAISNLSSSVTLYKNTQSELLIKQNNLKLEQAGATNEDIEQAITQIKSAQASLLNTKAMLAKTLITAPFSGIITKIDAKVGEVASSNLPLVQMMSVGSFQIESYVPEVNIALIKLDDNAKITLDAYGDDVLFNAKVISIDPAETIKDGVSTYKTKLQFLDKDDRIKRGMTANISIITFSKPNVIVVPGGVVFERDGRKFLQVKENNKILDKEIIVGNISSLGQFEVVSGLTEGSVVLLNPKIK